jgi:hypothetical protein
VAAQVNSELVRFSESAQTLDVDKEVEAYTAQIVAMETKADSARMELESLDLGIRYRELALLAEAMDSRVRNMSDLERVTRLPVLATLGDLRQMSPE